MTAALFRADEGEGARSHRDQNSVLASGAGDAKPTAVDGQGPAPRGERIELGGDFTPVDSRPKVGALPREYFDLAFAAFFGRAQLHRRLHSSNPPSSAHGDRVDGVVRPSFSAPRTGV